MIKPNTVVFAQLPKGFENSYPFKDGELLLFLGEITNRPGHCVVANSKGKIWWGFHTENFVEEPQEE